MTVFFYPFSIAAITLKPHAADAAAAGAVDPVGGCKFWTYLSALARTALTARRQLAKVTRLLQTVAATNRNRL